MSDPLLILRALLVWALLAVAEVLLGLLRVRLVNRRVGDHRARQLGVVVSGGVIMVLTWFTLPWLDARGGWQLLGVGLLWLVLMLAFDVVIGRAVFRFGWSRILSDFDPRRGNLLGLGMLFLLAAPLLAGVLRGLF